MKLGSLMTTKALLLSLNCVIMVELMAHLMVIEVYGAQSNAMSNGVGFDDRRNDVVRKMQAIKQSIAAPPSSLISPSPNFPPSLVFFNSHTNTFFFWKKKLFALKNTK